jgi:hypothetical protein
MELVVAAREDVTPKFTVNVAVLLPLLMTCVRIVVFAPTRGIVVASMSVVLFHTGRLSRSEHNCPALTIEGVLQFAKRGLPAAATTLSSARPTFSRPQPIVVSHLPHAPGVVENGVLRELSAAEINACFTLSGDIVGMR